MKAVSNIINDRENWKAGSCSFPEQFLRGLLHSHDVPQTGSLAGYSGILSYVVALFFLCFLGFLLLATSGVECWSRWAAPGSKHTHTCSQV